MKKAQILRNNFFHFAFYFKASSFAFKAAANIYLFFLSSASLEGKVKLTSKAIKVTIKIIKVGKGLSNSATIGAKIVSNLELKLQVPIA